MCLRDDSYEWTTLLDNEENVFGPEFNEFGTFATADELYAFTEATGLSEREYFEMMLEDPENSIMLHKC